MKVNQIFTKTNKSLNEEIKAKSHNLLIRGGFINQEMAGIYTILPLGYKVLRKIENIIREEMDLIGGQEILMPALHPKENWIQSKRWESLDVLFKVKSRWGSSEYALGPTHEEIVFPLVGKFISSYKDLPISVYQIQSKFRDEKRAKSGIIRGREFGMKDMYSFHENQEDLSSYYEKAKSAYLKIFKRCGVNAKVTKASGGSFTKKYSHEFMAISEAGEDLIFACKSCVYAENSEVSSLKEGDSCPECNDKIKTFKAIEIGNIFDLGKKFCEDFNVSYTDKNGEKKFPITGCYGIGTTRLIGSIVESSNDDRGIIWPDSVSPFSIYLISLEGCYDEAEEIYKKLKEKNVEILFDDREDKGPGEKFADADLLGIPIRAVVSKKTIKDNKIEIKKRNSQEIDLINIQDFLKNYDK